MIIKPMKLNTKASGMNFGYFWPNVHKAFSVSPVKALIIPITNALVPNTMCTGIKAFLNEDDRPG